MIPKLLHPYGKPAKDSDDYRHLVKSEGVRLWDRDGNEYIDALGSLWYCQVGYGRTEIIDAVKQQMETLLYNVFDPWANDIAEAAAARIASVSPHPDGRVFLACSGSEAVDSAFKIARAIPQLRGEPERQIVLRRTRGYHGVAGAGTSLQGIAPNREGWGDLMPHIVEIDPDDIESAARVFAEHGDRIAAVITEPVQGAGGVFPPPFDYLRRLRELCDQNGSLLIFDEVICGFGRTGEWFGAQSYDIRPDLMTFAKGVTSGYQPMGGVIVSREICDQLESDPDYLFRHGFTYSGHPAAAAAAVANIDIIANESLVERARHIGVQMHQGLEALVADGNLSASRGIGALWAAKLPEGTEYPQTVAVRDRMLDMGVVCRPIGDSLAFCPPLVISDEDIARVLDVLAEATAAPAA